MAKANNGPKATTKLDTTTAIQRIRLFCEKAMGHGLVSTEDEKQSIEDDLLEIESELPGE